MLVHSNRLPFKKASCARDVASLPEPAAVTSQGMTLRPLWEPPSHAHSIASNSLSISTAENNDATIQNLQNSPLQTTLSVPSYTDGGIHGVQSLSVAGMTSAVTTATQSVTLCVACRPQSANTETSTAATQGSTQGATQATYPLQASTALSSATTGSGPVTQNIQNTANLYTQNSVVALGKVNAKIIYSRDIPAEVQLQYLSIEAKLNKGLRKYLEKKKKSKKGLTLTLMMLGQNSHNNEPHIVLTCEPKSEPFVHKYLHKDRVEPIWRGEEGKGFKLEIDTMTPQPATLEALQDQSCSFSIEFHHKDRSLFATIGGNIILCYPDGSSQQYGLTVNHLFDLCRDDDSEDAASFYSNSDSEDSDSSFKTNESIVSGSSTISSQDSDAENRLDVWESVRGAPTGPQQSQGGVTASVDTTRIALGRLVPKTFVSHVARNRDWALIEYVEQPLSRFDVQSKPQGHLEAATFNSLEGWMPVSVFYRGTAHTGRLNAAPTNTVVPGGSLPVSVYTFSFDEAPVDTSGISGSWIVRGSENYVQIYGQVVAKDAFGGLHVVPIVDILQDVKRVFKVDMVYLHGHNIVSEETEGFPVPTSSPRFISSDPKHEDTQSGAVNDGASSSDTMRMHDSIQAHTISSSVEFHTTPGSSQGNLTMTASSQQEHIVNNSTLEVRNTLGSVPQAVDAPFDSFATQHELKKERKNWEITTVREKAMDAGLNDGGLIFITGGKPADFQSKRVMTMVRKKAMDAWLKSDSKPTRKARSPTGRLRYSSVDSESRGSTRSKLSVGSQDAVTDLSTIPTSLSIGTGSAVLEIEEALNRSPVTPRSYNIKPAGVEETAYAIQQSQELIAPQAPLFPKFRPEDLRLYNSHILPRFVSLGKNIDPFRTMFQSGYPSASIEDLKIRYNQYFGTRGLGRYWIPTALSYPHTFLGTLCLAAAYHDVIYDRALESVQTIALRQEVIYLVGRNMSDLEARTSDHNLMALIQLIISEVISREEFALSWHEDAIQKMIQLRGGLDKLGVNGRLASVISWVSLATSVLREQQPWSMYAEYCVANSTRQYRPTALVPESPIYCPRASWITIFKSERCTQEAKALLDDIRIMIDSFLSQTGSNQRTSQTLMALYKKITDPAKYPPISDLKKIRVLTPHDYKYEAIRVASIIQAVAIVRRVALSEALSHATDLQNQTAFYDSFSLATSTDFLIPPREISIAEQSISPSTSTYITSPAVPQHSYFPAAGPRSSALSANAPRQPFSSTTSAARPSISSTHSAPSGQVYFAAPPAPAPSRATTLLSDLRETIECSNISACWSDMAGVLLWVCLVVGAASRQSESKIHRKYFSALTMRLGVMLCFEHPEAINSSLVKMSEVVEALHTEKATPEKAEGKGKKRKI